MFFAAGAMCALAFTVAHAQTDAGDETKAADIPGLLGRTYMSANAGAFQVRHDVVKPTGFIAGGDVNLPIDDGFDYHLNFFYDHASKAPVKVRDMQVDNDVAYYYRTKLASPFLSAGFGYDWAHETVPNSKSIKNHFVLEAGTGVEVPVAKSSAVTLSLNYDQSTGHPEAKRFAYGFGANHWFNDTLGASVGATLRQGRSGAHDAILYVAGVHFSFD